LTALFSVLEKGRFLVNPKAVCDFCDYGAVCGKDANDRIKEKIESNQGEFAIFTELEEYGWARDLLESDIHALSIDARSPGEL